MFNLFTCRALAERLRDQTGQTIAEATIALAVLGSAILIAVSALALGSVGLAG